MGTQKNRLNETVLLSTQNIWSNCWVFYAQTFCFTGPMGIFSATKYNNFSKKNPWYSLLHFQPVRWIVCRQTRNIKSDFLIYILCMQGNFSWNCGCLLTFFKINFFQKNIKVNLFVSRSFCRSWSGSKLFAKVISRWQKLPVRSIFPSISCLLLGYRC